MIQNCLNWARKGKNIILAEDGGFRRERRFRRRFLTVPHRPTPLLKISVLKFFITFYCQVFVLKHDKMHRPSSTAKKAMSCFYARQGTTLEFVRE